MLHCEFNISLLTQDVILHKVIIWPCQVDGECWIVYMVVDGQRLDIVLRPYSTMARGLSFRVRVEYLNCNSTNS